MATVKDQLQAPSSESLDAGYETSIVSIKGLAIFAVCLIVFAAVLHTAIWYLLKAYVHADELADRPKSALTDPDMTGRSGVPIATLPPPPAPRLQPEPTNDRVPAADLQLMFRHEDTIFRQMGWQIDEQSHVQTEIPDAVLSRVIQEETSRQQAKTKKQSD
jgi:hypothetical protein